MHKFLLLFFVIITLSHNSFGALSEKDSLYQVLDLTLENNDNFYQLREQKILSLKRLIKDFSISEEYEYSVNCDIFNEYAPFQCDSALHYLSKNVQLSEKFNDEKKYIQSLLMYMQYLTRTGMYKEAYDYYCKINRDNLPESLKEEFLYSNYYLSNEIAFSTRDYTSNRLYSNSVKSYMDSIFKIVDRNSMRYFELKEKQHLDGGDYDSAFYFNDKRLEMVNKYSPEYGNIGFMRSLIYQFEGNHELKEIELLKTSIADIETGKRDIAALTFIATILYERGEINRAYRYMKFVFECAKLYNGTLRVSQISDGNSLINSAYLEKENKQKMVLASVVIGISMLFMITIILVVYIIKQMKILAKTRNQLADANLRMSSLNAELVNNNVKLKELNNLKEGYITLFLEMCSSYIEKLEDYNLRIHRKLVVGKYEEVLNMTNTKKSAGAELKEFYDNFDKTFINLYPTFIEEFNTLLRKEEQIYVRNNEFLTTELRIFALIRLGITDSNQIASFLRCSVNTIYTYRTKVRNKSCVPREQFEEHIQNISRISE